MQYALKRLQWYQQDLFDAEGDVNDFINMVEMDDEDIAKLPDELKKVREHIIKRISESNNLQDAINYYIKAVQNILMNMEANHAE